MKFRLTVATPHDSNSISSLLLMILHTRIELYINCPIGTDIYIFILFCRRKREMPPEYYMPGNILN